MNILFKSSENLDKRSLYIHTRGSSISLKDVEDGTVIDPLEIVVYEDENGKGEVNTITSVISVDGKTFANKNLLEEMLASHEVAPHWAISAIPPTLL